MSVYISYSKDDELKAKLLAEELNQNGVEVWFDTGQISPGENFAESISSAIKSADIFVALISPASRGSNWFASELAAAIAARDVDRHRKIIPVLLSGFSDMPAFLRSYQAIDGSSNDKLKTAAIEVARIGRSPKPPVELDNYENLKAEIALAAAREAALSREIAYSIAERDRADRSRLTGSLMTALTVIATAATVAAVIGLAIAGSASSAIAIAVVSSILGALGAIVGFYFGRYSKDGESDE